MRTRSTPLDQYSRIPLTVIGGAPGAGKTSLVRHLLGQTTGRRIAVVAADERAIDPGFVARREGPLFIMRNGCVCVIATDDGAAALADLAEGAERPEHAIIDGDGRTDARRLSGYGYMPGYRLDGTILVLDAPGVRRAVGDTAAEADLCEQTSMADVVILNKIDLSVKKEIDEAHRLIERLAPTTRVVWSEYARVSPPLLLGSPDGADALDACATVAQWTPEFVPVRPQARAETFSGRSQRGDRHRAWCLVSENPIDGKEFRGWVQRLPAVILSGRGAVYLREEPLHRQAFHLLGSRWRLERAALWGQDSPSTRLLLAGLGGTGGARRGPREHDDAGAPA